ncbi:EAL domain-containing protein [Plantactinospora sp. GCM10030261]|uniref:EAL domain-containing protein n=1 Tax=Plantactinospora sp. GCM10030261 TaxID=3273420 RepID=UPI00362271EF
MEAASLRNSVPPGRAAAFFGFVWTVVAVAVAISAAPLTALPGLLSTLPVAFWLMAALAVAADAHPFTPPGRRSSPAVFPSVCLTFAILLGWGLGPAIATQTAAVAVSSWRMRHTVWRAAFNAAQYAWALGAAYAVTRLAPRDLLSGWPAPWTDVAVAAAAAASWFLVSYGLVTLALRMRFGTRWWPAFRQGFAFEAVSNGALLLLAPVLVAAARTTAALVPLVLVPLYAVSRMVRLSGEQERLTRLDPLTGLANRKALLTDVTEQLALHAERAAKGAPVHLALLLLDLDRFKHVNDALGHAVGDRLLVEVGHRLVGTVRPGDTVVRLGGDEFAIVAGGLPDVDAAREIADRVVAALTEPVSLDGLPLDVGGSIGIALYPAHGRDIETLMRHADVAMYDAKHRGDTVAVYAPESDHNSPERLSLLADLRQVLEAPGATGSGDAGEIAMYYQPQIAIATGQVVGVEALLRWRHPRRGMVDPEELIRVAEQSAVMRLLTRRVVDDVVEQVAKWSAAGMVLRAAVNVSVRDLHTGEIADQIADRLARFNVPPEQLQLEITEGALMADPRRVLATISRLDKIGVAIALDDFGTGYSSMQHLRRLPLAEVKVDRSFVLGMAVDADDAAIVRSMIELAGALGLRVVAEGVEDERTWRLLHAAGCDIAQGWFYARPMPAEDLAAWLSRYRPLKPGPAQQGGGRHRWPTATIRSARVRPTLGSTEDGLDGTGPIEAAPIVIPPAGSGMGEGGPAGDGPAAEPAGNGTVGSGPAAEPAGSGPAAEPAGSGPAAEPAGSGPAAEPAGSDGVD